EGLRGARHGPEITVGRRRSRRYREVPQIGLEGSRTGKPPARAGGNLRSETALYEAAGDLAWIGVVGAVGNLGFEGEDALCTHLFRLFNSNAGSGEFAR